MLFQALPCSFMQMHVYVVQCKPLPTVAATPATQPLGLASPFPPSPQCRIIFLFFFLGAHFLTRSPPGFAGSKGPLVGEVAALPGRLGLQHGGGEGAGEQAPENHNDQPLAIQRTDAGVTQFRCRSSSVWVGYLFEPGGVKKSGPPRPKRHHLSLVIHGLCLFPLCLLPFWSTAVLSLL